MADVGGADNHVLETLLVKMMGNLARATNENALLLKQAFPYLSNQEFETAYAAGSLAAGAAGTAKGKRGRKRKAGGAEDGSAPPKKKRDPSGYILFCNDLRSQLKTDGVDHGKPASIMTELARRWKALPAETRDRWNDKAKAEAAVSSTVTPPEPPPAAAGAAPAAGTGEPLSEKKHKKHKKDKEKEKEKEKKKHKKDKKHAGEA